MIYKGRVFDLLHPSDTIMWDKHEDYLTVAEMIAISGRCIVDKWSLAESEALMQKAYTFESVIDKKRADKALDDFNKLKKHIEIKLHHKEPVLVEYDIFTGAVKIFYQDDKGKYFDMSEKSVSFDAVRFLFMKRGWNGYSKCQTGIADKESIKKVIDDYTTYSMVFEVDEKRSERIFKLLNKFLSLKGTYLVVSGSYMQEGEEDAGNSSS